MKKLLSLLLAIILLIGVSHAFCEQEEFTFRGVHFGTKYTDVMNEFSAYSWENMDPFPGTGVMNTLKNTEDTFTYNTQFRSFAYDTGISVGGHKVDAIRLDFLFGKDKNGTVSTNSKDSIFFGAMYYFEATEEKDADLWFKEYKDKLTALYGKATNTWQDWPTPFSARQDFVLWKSGNVYIRLKEYSNLNLLATSDYYVTITYMWADADPLLTEINKLQKDSIMEDSDGL